MTFQPAGPGKTAPKLLHDFLSFDPIRGKPNVLSDHTPPHGEGPQLAAPIGTCSVSYQPVRLHRLTLLDRLVPT